jgi:3'-phosphoadenosine 5'-phosphosulfate (PAPS) 3'-phosphatase
MHTLTLSEAFPDIPILSEEGRDIPHAERAAWRR